MLERRFVCGLLAIGLAGTVAQASMLPTPLTNVVFYDFSINGNGTPRTAGENWAQAGNGYWGDSGAGSLATVYSDGGNLCGKWLPNASDSNYKGVFLNKGLANAMKDYPINVLSVKVKALVADWANWDKAVQFKWGNDPNVGPPGGQYAYGSTYGTGFSIATENGVGSAMGSFGMGTARVGGGQPWPDHAYQTGTSNPLGGPGKASFGTTQWVTLAVAINRDNGWVEWYRNDVMYASYQVLKTDPNYAEWIWGSGLTNPRWMQWIEIGVQGKLTGSTGALLFDDFTMAGGVPEPSSLLAWAVLGVAACLVRRRGV